MKNIHQTEEYQKVFNSSGYKPVNLFGAYGHKIYFHGIPHKTIFGGMCGDGLLNYDNCTIKNIIKNSSGEIVVYSFNEHKILEDFGFKKNDDWTMIVDISNIDQLWNSLDKKNRNVIRFAEKNNVLFKEVKNKEEIINLYNLFKEQAVRWNFRIPQKDYFENVWDYMVDKNMAKFFYAEYNGEIVSIIQIFMEGNVISMPIWGNNEKAKEIKANNFLIWKTIEWANKNGYLSFNMWGANPKLEGIWKFKESFGAKPVNVYRYEKAPLFYKTIRKFLKKE